MNLLLRNTERFRLWTRAIRDRSHSKGEEVGRWRLLTMLLKTVCMLSPTVSTVAIIVIALPAAILGGCLPEPRKHAVTQVAV